MINHRLASGPCFRINGSEKMRKREEPGRIPWVMKNFHAAIITRSGRVEHNYWMKKKLLKKGSRSRETVVNQVQSQGNTMK